MENPTKTGEPKPQKIDVKRLQEELLEEAFEVIEDIHSYTEQENDPKNEALLSGIELLTGLVNLSGESPAKRLQTLFEATNTDCINLFPLTHLKYEDGLKIEMLNNFMGKLDKYSN